MTHSGDGGGDWYPWRSRKIVGASGMSVVFLLALVVAVTKGGVPAEVLHALAIGVATAWTAQTGTQGWEDASRARAPSKPPA